MKIPYGLCDFSEIRAGGFFYADKTSFLPVLERAESGYRHLVFLRPRRFGKSTLLSMLKHYYDAGRKEQFDRLFKGLWIHERPTAEQGSYLVLSFDFSGVATDGGHDALRRSFLDTVRESVHDWVFWNRDVAPEIGWLEDRIDGYESPESLLGGVFHAVHRAGRKLYVLIDEYDHFANRLLSDGAEDLYEESIVKRTGFIRTFYAKLKAGTASGAVGRMFITGVTPLMLDDLSSGFNMATAISMSPRFNTLAGFTHADVERALDEFLSARPALLARPEIGDRGRLVRNLELYYDGYRFSPDEEERVFNADMVLYFLRELDDRGRYPNDMLDPNVRTAYHHLQRIGTLGGRRASERRALFEEILSEGCVTRHLVRQFGVASLTSDTQLMWLLYYLGMLTFGPGEPDSSSYRLEIPNRVIRELQWEYLALMFKEQEEVSIDVPALGAALHAMGVQGDIQPFLSLFHERVVRIIGLKDTRRFDERSLKLMLMTYLSLGRMFHILSEKEFAQGYCDLFLGATEGAQEARFSWLLELKYLRAGAREAQIERAFAEAAGQIARYASDGELLPLLLGRRELRAGAIVFVGTRKVLFRPWPAEGGAAQRRGRKAASGEARR